MEGRQPTSVESSVSSPAPATTKQQSRQSSVAAATVVAPESMGAPTRQWLNSEVTPVLLEGMRWLASERPVDPVHALGEFLIKRAKENRENSDMTDPPPAEPI